MRLNIRTIATIWLLAGTVGLAAPSPNRSMRLYVTNSESGTITVIDLGALKVVGEIKVGGRIHGAAVEADGRRLFTTIESNNTLEIIDTATDRVTASVPSPHNPEVPGRGME